MSRDPRTDPRLRGVVLLKVKEVAELMGISTRQVWRLSAAGDLPAPIVLGRRTKRWRAAELEYHLSKLRGER